MNITVGRTKLCFNNDFTSILIIIFAMCSSVIGQLVSVFVVIIGINMQMSLGRFDSASNHRFYLQLVHTVLKYNIL